MVVVNVTKLTAENRVEFDSNNMIGRIAIVVDIEKAEVLTRKSSGEASGRRENEGDSMAAEVGVFGEDREDESGGEGENRAIGGVLELYWGGIEGMAFFLDCVVCELEETVGGNLGDAIEG